MLNTSSAARRFRRVRFRTLACLLTLAVAASAVSAQPSFIVEVAHVAKCKTGTHLYHYEFVEGDFEGSRILVAITKDGKIITRHLRGDSLELLVELSILCSEALLASSTAAASQQLIAGGLLPSHAAVGDWNGDGLPDLAISNQGSDNVSVALGTDGGGFGPTVNFLAGDGPVRIAAGDLNNDGKLDLVTVNAGSGNLSLLLGNGNGTFQAPIPISAGAAPLDVVLGDWNGDGKLDLAAADSSGNAVVVLLGNGAGSFQPPVALSAGTSFPTSIVAVDLNGDGKLDLVSNGAVFLGNGNGTFQAAINFATGLQPSLVRAGDLNRDGKPDIVTLSSGRHIASVHLGNGDGSLQPARHYVTGNTPTELQVVDIDGNGALDLVVSHASDDHISIFLGRGEGTFAAAAHAGVPNLGFGALGAAVADFTGDGVPDLLTSDVALLPGLGLGRFGAAVPIAGLSGERIVGGDWNGDAKIDLALTTSSQLRIALGNGNGTFAAPATFALPAGSPTFRRFPLVVDVNSDGKPDLVVANPGHFDALDGSLSVFVNNGNGTFTPRPDVPLGSQAVWIAAGDVNGDGKPDLVVANLGKFGQTNGSIFVMLGDGNGGFTAGQVLRSGIEPDSVGVADLNGDGKLDVVAVVQAPVFDWNLNVFLGNGAGGFGDAVVVALPQDLITGLRLADLDLDGRPDVVVSLDGTKLGLLRNRGDGSFDPPVLVDAGGGNTGSVVLADLNRDGRPDIVVATSIGLVNVLLNATPVPGAPGTVASILPVSRAVPVSVPATVFATILNPSGVPFSNCDITPIPTLPGTFLFQTTDPNTNAPTGSPNQRVGIAAGGSQTFVLAFTPQAAFPTLDVEFAFACDGVIPADAIASVNTLTLSATATPGPDIIALAASVTPGQLIANPGGAFAVATANVGVGGDVSVDADTGGATLPLVLAWCQTDAGGNCQSVVTSSPLPVFVPAGATPTFAIFGTATGAIAFDPALHRIFFRIRNLAGHVIGATSLAVSGGP